MDYYPVSEVKIKKPKNDLIDFIKSMQIKPKIYFEIGSNIGTTARIVHSLLGSDSLVFLFDFDSNKQYIQDIIKKRNVKFFGSNEKKIYDSYNWKIMSLLRSGISPDFVFIDGKHTFDADWLCFFLIDQMLTDDGYIYFDDYNWTIENSPRLNPKKFLPILDMYTNEQIKSSHIKLLVDNIVKKKYKEILKNRLYQKISYNV